MTTARPSTFLRPIAILGIDFAEYLFHLHGVDAHGRVVSKQVSQAKLAETVAQLAPRASSAARSCEDGAASRCRGWRPAAAPISGAGGSAPSLEVQLLGNPSDEASRKIYR